MVKIFYKIVNGYKIKFCRAYFCIGIGMDQLTPAYYRFATGISMGPVKSKQKELSPKKQSNKEQTKKLSKLNYNKRAKNQY